MWAYSNVHTLTVNFADPTEDNVFLLGKLSSRMAHVEILEAWAVVDTTITLGNGTGIALTLLDYGTGGTVNSGTVSSILGGTAVTWTTQVPKDFVISEGTFTGGRYLALKYDETGTIVPLNLTVSVNWVEGASG